MKPDLMRAILDEADHLREQIEPERPGAQGLEKYYGPDAVPHDDIELAAQPALAELGGAVNITIRWKTSAITLLIGAVRGNFGIDGYDPRRPLRGRR